MTPPALVELDLGGQITRFDVETISSLYRSCELSGGQERERDGKDEEEGNETTFFLRATMLHNKSALKKRSPEYTGQPGTHRKKKVTSVQVTRKMPRLLLSSSASVYAAMIPAPGIRMVAYDIPEGTVRGESCRQNASVFCQNQ